MLSKGLGSLLVSLSFLASSPAFAQVPGGRSSLPETAAVSLRQHAPMKFHGLRPDGTVESENWSGYAVTGSAFTSAQGSWTVPSVDCDKTPNTYGSFWVGIDGYSSDTVEQTGTDSDCDGENPDYYAWYEFYPAASVLISGISVSPGDQMSAEVTYNGSEFKVEITNETTGQSFSKSKSVSGAKRSSAEWITEAPCCTARGGILPLSDFGTVFLGVDYTGVGGTDDAADASASEMFRRLRRR